MTEVTFHIDVRALQRKIALRFMIEVRRLPMLRIVTIITTLRLSAFHELAGVRIVVAAGTHDWSGAERNFRKSVSRRAGFVTFLTFQFRVAAH